jgi:glycosyltransferase involved in cell wall biosynthesis
MKILQILPSLDDGGVERGTVDSNRLYVTAGHESWVISAGGKRVVEIERDGGKHITLDVKSKNPLTALPRMLALRKAIKQIQPDIIHFRSRVPGWLTLWANATRPLRLPVVSTLHGLNHPCFYSSVMVRADRVICVSTAGLNFVKENYPWVPDDKLKIIPRGVDIDFFSPDALNKTWMDTFIREHNLAGKFIATAIGRVSALKGIDTLVRAIAELKDTHPDCVALIVGGPQKNQERVMEELHTLAAELGVSDRIHFVGSQRAIPEIAALSNVVCSCNTKKPESFGRTVAEALAMNTPVIAAKHGGVLDIIRDGIDGYFYTPGNATELAQAIIKVKTTPFGDLRTHIAENFTAECLAKTTLALYEDLLK